MKDEKKVSPEQVWKEYDEGMSFKGQINLFETVKNNENFYIGKQWEGVQANGLPTPVFNFIKRLILYLVASTATDNAKMTTSPLASTAATNKGEIDRVCDIVNDQFEALFESNKVSALIRQFMRNAAVDGDGCLYAYFDPEGETGQMAKGVIRTELLENTRVIFGNPNSRKPQEQPYIIVARRERVEDVKARAKEYGGDADNIRDDTDDVNDRFDAMTHGKVTTLMKFYKDGKTIRAVETTKEATIRKDWDTEMKLYPIVWLNWDYVQNSYHGQAAVTGLIPNQIFVNKMFAMTMISLMTTAYPKIMYDRTKVSYWDSGVGKAIAVDPQGGSLNDVAKSIDPAVISPQVSQFIELAVNMTKEFMGATDAALGEVKPDNTSAIIALQKSSSVPLEIVKQDLYQAIEDLGLVWLDLMRVFYGERYVELKPSKEEERMAADMGLPAEPVVTLFDFHALEQLPLSLKLDVGGSAYWSEIAQMNTLDNLLVQGQISIVDYLERVPQGYISNQQDLIDTLKERMTPQMGQMGGSMPLNTVSGENAIASGEATLQQKVRQQGADQLKVAR